MALNVYTGTNNHANASGHFRRYISEFTDARGVMWRVEILDDTNADFNFSASSPQRFDLGRDGFTISWDGQADHLHEAIVPSSLTMDFLLAGTRHTIFPDVLADCEEDRFLVAVYEFIPDINSTAATPSGQYFPEWFGTISPEGIEYVSNETNEFLRITAHDGLAALNDIPYQKANGDVYDTDATLAVHLRRVLEKLPTAHLWGYGIGAGDPTTLADNNSTGPFFLQEIPHVATQHVLEQVPAVPGLYSALKTHLAKAAAFYEIETSEDQFGGTFATKTTSTCGQVLDAILQVIQAQIFLTGGSFWVMNWAALEQSTPYVHRFVKPSSLTDRAVNAVGAILGDIQFDLETNFEAVRGLSTRYLFPIQRAVSVHKKGGSKILVAGTSTHTPMGGQDPVTGVYVITDSSASSPTILSSPDAVVLGGDSPLMKGDVYGIPTGKDLGALDEGLIGCKTLIVMTIKVGDYYLKRNVVQSSEGAVNIHRTTQADLDYHDLVQDGDVEWTTSASTYTIVTPHVGMGSPEPDVILQGDDDEIQRVAGYHIKIRNNETEFKFRSVGSGTFDGRFADFTLDWTLPPLPDGVAEHVGVEFKAVVVYKSRLNATISPSTHDSIADLNGLGGRIGNFKIFSTADSGENDVTFVADHTKNRAIVKVAETILGDAYTGADSVGALRHWNFSSSQWVRTGSSGQKWGTTTDTDADLFVHELLAKQAIQERNTTTPQISGTFIFRPSAVQYNGVTNLAYNLSKVPRFWNLWNYEIGAEDRKYFAQTLTWTARSMSFDFQGFLVDVDRTFTPNSTDDDQVAVGFTGGGSGPNEDATGGGGLPGALQVVRAVANTNTGSGTGLTTTQTNKLAAISINASNEIDGLTTENGAVLIKSGQVDDSGNSTHRFATQSQLNAIASNTTRIGTAEGDIDDLEDDIQVIRRALKDTTGGGGKGVYYDDNKATAKSHVAVQQYGAKLQAGAGTSYQASESSPGRLSLNVAAGPSGSETAFEAIRVQGQTTAGKAVVTFASGTSVSGLQASMLSDVQNAGSGRIITDAERTKLNGIETGADVNPADTDEITEGSVNLYHTNARVDARIAAANVTDLADVTSAGSGSIITAAERTKLSGVESGAERNVVEDNLATADQTLEDNRTIDADGNDFDVDMNGGGEFIVKDGSSEIAKFSNQGGVTLSGLSYPSTDGSAGQFLKTDGSGNLSFAAASGGSSNSYVLASSSTRVPLYWGGRYYFGSVSYGWDTDTGYSYGATGDSSLPDDYAHLGIVAPTAISTLKIFATLRNDTSGDDVEVHVYKGSRPNGSSSSISLTGLIEVSVSNTQDRHHNADGTKTSAGISAGDLIFVAFRRTTTTNGTQYLNASYTLHATE